MFKAGLTAYLFPALIIVLSLIIDIAVNDPPNRYHPTAWLGKVISALTPKFKADSSKIEKANGVLLAIVTIAIYATPIYLLVSLCHFNYFLEIVVAALALKITFALKCMDKHVRPIATHLQHNDISSARQAVALIVRRDVSAFNTPLITSAAIESTAESIVDGFASPLFYYSLFGIAGAAIYRAINTLDSMVGYKDPYFVNIGWFSAKLDTLANWIPARLATIILAFSALVLGLDWRNSIRIAVRDHRNTESLNAGWIMSAMAGALNVRLEKPGYYVLGKELPTPKDSHIVLALKVMYVTCILFTAFICIPLSILFSYLWMWFSCL
ncbi:MAG: cobalamin biosynthesis protein [Candidatus Methanomethylicota archaeon]|uniref:Probable cobalamin biosynthesis protein CobD n=1 Tax=Thermoproteota archaeon TaxID=2056631 RepID=A0A497EQX2_9CREN|nr:MAG: cobalamin biosynthesis protein [Candidatus Verstraetearchaeota archaeon]